MKVEKLLVFPLENVVRAMQKGFKELLRIYAKICQNETWKNNTERMLNICQNGDQNRIQNEKWNEKTMQKDNAESGCSER